MALAEASVATLEPLGPSLELARAYANLAGQRMLDGESAAAIRLAARAEDIAESLGDAEVLSDALNTEGCARAGLGQEWASQLQRALDIAVSARLPEQAGRAFTNICSIYCGSTGNSPKPSGTSRRASPIATSTTSPPTRAACAATGSPPWSAPGAGPTRRP